MSILINLLPDVRQAKLREHQRRQLATSIAVVTWVVCAGAIGLMFAYELGQKAVIAGHNKNIAEKKQRLEAVPGLLEALTAQQHSASLPGLYAQRVYLTKFFQAYGEVNPGEVTLSSMTIDSQNALVVSGFARTFASVSKAARALEAAHVKVGTGAAETNSPYFSNVTITSVSSVASKGVSFTLSATLASGVTNGSN